MSVNIADLYIGQWVRLPEGERGTVAKIDYDEPAVWVDVQLSNGRISREDIHPDEPGFEAE